MQQPSDFMQLITKRLAELETRLERVDLHLADQVKKAVSIAGVDLPFSLAKARYILELAIQNIYRRELPQGKPKPLFNMIEDLVKVEGLFNAKLLHDINYIRINGNLMIHAQEGPVTIQERDVEAIILLTFNVVEWYLLRYQPTRALPQVAPPLDDSIPPNPYRGLAAFREEDSAHFFGRKQETEELVTQVAARPLVALVGASGSGKSSLVFAGIFPRLRALGNWRLAVFRPGNRPFFELAKVLAGLMYQDKLERAEKTQDLATKLETGQVELESLIELILEGSADRLLLVVDQFEEVFTLNPDPALRNRFLDLLSGHLPAFPGTMTGHSPNTGNVYCLLLTLRADFIGRALEHAPLTRAFDLHPPKLLGPIGDAQALRAIIEQPARQSNVAWQPLLIERILRDVQAQPVGTDEGARINLPLLEFTLEQLWQRQGERTLTHLAYEELGGVQQALARHADQVLNGFDAQARERLQHIITQLVCPGEGTEDTRQVATKAQVGEAQWELVTRLADARLVVTRHDAQGQDTVELIHEALLRHWPPLRQWVAENRQFRLWQNRLRQALDDWQHHGQDPGALLRGARLVEAEDWLHRQGERLGPPEQHFIQVSLNERERAIQARRRNQHRLIAGLTAGLIGALSLAGYAWIQRNRAEQASEVAILARGQAEDLINYMLFELRDKLQPIGRVDLLDGASRKAAAYFETLPAPEASAASERNRGVALDNIGDVRQTQGDLSGARAAYEAGLVIAERLARQDPANTVLQRDLTVSYNKIGEVCQAQGDLTAARAAYEAGLAIAEQQTRHDPTDAAWQRDLSISHNKIGDLRLAEGDLLGAQSAYEAGLTIAARLARQDPANVVWQRDLSISHNQIGDVRLAKGDLTKAQDAYETSLAVIERLARQDQANTGWQRDLWLSHNLIGDVLQAKDDLPGAQRAYEAGLAIIERLARQDPGNAGWQRDLAVSHNQIGRVRKAQGDLAGARIAYEADLAIAEGLARQDPANAEWQHDLWVSRNQIGEIRKAQDDLAGARTAYEEGLTIAEWLTRQAPANAGWQRDLALSHNQIGNVLQAQGDLAGAREAFQRELAILLPLATRTEAPEEPLLFGNVYDRLVTVSTAQGDIRAAITYQRDWVEQVRKTADQSDLAESLWVLYGLEDQAGNNRDALAVNTEVLTLARDLYQRQQDDDRRQFLAEVLGNRAFTLLLDRQLTAAIAAAEEGMALDPKQGWIIINQAHGYLLSGQFEKARAIYREHMRDTVYDHQTFPETVFDDFVRLRQSGLGHPDMEKIEALLKVSEKPRATSKTRKQ